MPTNKVFGFMSTEGVSMYGNMYSRLPVEIAQYIF